MKIDHTALWTLRPETLRDFYVRYFGGASGEKYCNPAKGFESYMVRFGDGCSLELMRRRDVTAAAQGERLGLCHLAFDAGSREAVLAQTERLRTDGVTIAGEPRTTGDGCFESVVTDPDGNLIEIVSH